MWEREESRTRWTHLLQLLELRLDQLRTLKDMQQSVTHLEEAERLQRALFAIADQASADRDMPDVFRSLHEIVGSLMYAENFYIVLFDPRARDIALRLFRRRRRHRTARHQRRRRRCAIASAA